jgi:BolA family transcriptional regulator, general stress-responsive regulator
VKTQDRIRERMERFHPLTLEIVDASAAHAGHAGAASGGGHFQLTIVSEQFSGMATVARHRLIYAALSDLMKKEIHALQIEAFTPDQR